MKIIDVDRATFNELDPTRRIIDAPHAHRFAIVHLDSFGDYGLAWNSTLIEPSITPVADSTLWLGVDENLVVLDLNYGRVLVALPLHYPLFEIVEVGSAIVVITELEVLVFNQNGSLRFTEGLPDIATNWSFQDEQMSIELLDKSRLRLDLQSGKVLSAPSAFVKNALNSDRSSPHFPAPELRKQSTVLHHSLKHLPQHAVIAL